MFWSSTVMTASIPKKDYRENDLAVTGENPYLKRLCQNFYKKFEKRHTRLYSPIQPKRRKSLLTGSEEGANPDVVFLTSQEL